MSIGDELIPGWVEPGAEDRDVLSTIVLQHGLDVDGVVVEAVAATEDGLAGIVNLPGESYARAGCSVERIVDVGGAAAGKVRVVVDHVETGGAIGVEDAEVRVVRVEGTFVVVAKAEIEVETLVDLPGILTVESVGGLEDLTLGGTQNDA